MNTYTNIYTLAKNPEDTKNLRALDPLNISLNCSKTMRSNCLQASPTAGPVGP